MSNEGNEGNEGNEVIGICKKKYSALLMNYIVNDTVSEDIMSDESKTLLD